VTVAQLKTGEITINGKRVITAGLSSYTRGREIALSLNSWIEAGTFLLTEPVAPLPASDSGYRFKPLKERPWEGLQEAV